MCTLVINSTRENSEYSLERTALPARMGRWDAGTPGFRLREADEGSEPGLRELYDMFSSSFDEKTIDSVYESLNRSFEASLNALLQLGGGQKAVNTRWFKREEQVHSMRMTL